MKPCLYNYEGRCGRWEWLGENCNDIRQGNCREYWIIIIPKEGFWCEEYERMVIE
jgi:hypothetical protein